MVKTSGEASIVLDREIDPWLREDVRSTHPAIYLCSVIYLPIGDKGTQDLLKNCLARMYLKIRRENMSTGFTFFIFAHVGQICTIGEHLVGAPIKSKWQLGNHSKV
ncbi:uncharacterized protein LOC120889783 isoform X2 [Ictidomys tridecemlineatus]